MRNVRYLYANFGARSRNFGNLVIDYATRYLMRDEFPAAAAEFDSFDRKIPLGSYDFVLVPGGTMITAGQNPGLEHIEQLGCPVYCLAGSLWTSTASPGLLLRKRVIRFRQPPMVDLRIVRKMTPPVGCRDRFTYELLRAEGIESYYTGCPTLMLPDDGVADDGYVLMSLGRGFVRTQTRYAARLARRHHIVGIVHEVDDYQRFRAAGWKLPLVTYCGDLDLYLSYFKRAAVVVSGRLHGVLPALGYDKPVFYYGTRDTRTTILDDLGVPVHSYREIFEAVDRASRYSNRHLLRHFRSNWDRVVQAIAARHLAPASQVRSKGATI